MRDLRERQRVVTRGLVTAARIIPREGAAPVQIEIEGDLAALMTPEQSVKGSTFAVVAGAGFEPTTFRL